MESYGHTPWRENGSVGRHARYVLPSAQPQYAFATAHEGIGPFVHLPRGGVQPTSKTQTPGLHSSRDAHADPSTVGQGPSCRYGRFGGEQSWKVLPSHPQKTLAAAHSKGFWHLVDGASQPFVA